MNNILQSLPVILCIITINVVVGAVPDPGSQSPESDVPWLSEVQKPPERIPRDQLGHFAPLLVDTKDRAIENQAAWKLKRREIRASWMKFLGPMPERPQSVEYKVLREERAGECLRQLIQYECEENLFMEAYIIRPPVRFTGKRPGIVAMHATTSHTIDQVAGVVASNGRDIGLKLAQRGFIIICPRNFLWQSVTNYSEAVDRHRKRHPRTLGMHKMLYDAQRATDILAGLPEVDAGRIGATGHSLGAKETLYLAAFDQRIRAAVASEGGTGFRSTNWDAAWYLGSGIHKQEFPLNHHQLLALTAPRAFLVLAGEKPRPAADGARTWPFIEAALPVYKLYGMPVRLGMHNHGMGHSIPPVAFERLASWLEAYLH